MNMIFIKVANLFKKAFALPRTLWFFAGVVIGLPILMSVAITSKGVWAAVIAGIVAVVWLAGVDILGYTLSTHFEASLKEYSAGVQWAMLFTIIALSVLILAPIPILTIVMALEVGRLAGIATGSCLAILYWLLLRIFPKLKFWDSTNSQECASS